MARPDGIQPFSADASVRVVQFAGITNGAALAAGYTPRRGIHCNVDGTYTIYDVDGVATKRYLLAGYLYPYANTKITSSTNSELANDQVSAEA